MSITITGKGEDQVGAGEAPFEVTMEIPTGYYHLSRAAPALKYPIEVATAANYDIQVTGSSGAETTEWTAWPLVEEMPEDGLIFWLLRGDVAFDYEKVPEAGKWFDPAGYVFLGPLGSANPAAVVPPGGVAARPQPFGMSDAMASHWTNASVWARLIPVANPEGEVASEPPYLMIYCFAGKGQPPLDDANKVLESVSIDYEGA